MTRLTLAADNARLAEHGVELVKGDGYFWFDGARDVPSVYVYRLNELTLKQWVEHVEEALK